MKFSFLWPSLGLALVIFFSACSSAKPSVTTNTDKELDGQLANIAALEQKIVDEEGDKFFADPYKRIQGSFAKARENKDLSVVKAEAAKTITAYERLLAATKDGKDKVSFLNEGITQELLKAEDHQAYLWIGPELLQVSQNTMQAHDTYLAYQLDKSLELYSQAYYQAQSLNTKLNEIKTQKEAELLMHTQKDLLQKSSGSSWSGDAILQKTMPQGPPSPLMEPPAEQLPPPPKNQTQAYVLPRNGTVAVLAVVEKPQNEPSQRTSQTNSRLSSDSSSKFLIDAQKEWEEGVRLYAMGDFQKARDYFLNSYKLLARHNGQSLEDTAQSHTVVPRDTLWDIAQKMYGNPFSWPLIWMNNRNLIGDPDLIYPGWDLDVPAAKP